MSDKDDAIIALIQKDETLHQGFNMLVETYSRPLYWQIRKIVLTHHYADDVLQDVFIKVWNNLSSFRGDSKLSTWLYRIATNESITFLNKERRTQNISINDDDSFLIEQLESDVHFDGDLAFLKLQKALVQLPERQRLVFTMRYFDEMKYSDMVEILEVSEGALKASYHHAVKKIEEFLLQED